VSTENSEKASSAATTAPAKRPAKRNRRNRRKWVTWSIVIASILVASCAVLSQVGLWRTRVAIEARQNSAASGWLSVAGWCWPRNAEWYFLSAVINRRAENFDAVEDNLKKSHSLGWPVSDLEREQLIAMAQTGQFRGVGNKWGELFQTAGSDGPEICKAYVNYALGRFRLDEAAAVLKGWKSDFPADPSPHVMEGKINIVLTQWDRAEQSFRRALEIDPMINEARLQLANCLIEQLEFTEAEQQLRAVSADFRASPDVIAALAKCVAQHGELDEALQLLNDGTQSHPASIVMEKTPANTEIRYALAQALRNSGDEESAQRHFLLVDEGTKALRTLPTLQSIITANPEDLETRFQMASITWKWKSRRDGAAWLQSILESDPNHQPAHRLLADHYEELGDAGRREFHKRMSGVAE
jgi:tetratricopeptide (TPR) repeat protein